MEQTPRPGQHILAFCGGTIEFTLRMSRNEAGRALLRTNIGHAETARLAVINEAIHHQRRLAEDWFDIPMRETAPGTYKVSLPLTEVGHFEAKTLFLPEGRNIPVWPEGDNTAINVHPADYCCGNSIYNAFVRLFGQEEPIPCGKDKEHYRKCKLLEDCGYAVVPPSGTFRDLIRQLDFITGELKCRILMLLPIHPTPTLYGRMGEFGSPYAALDYMDVDPALAEFDRQATPMEQFAELVDAVHARGAKIFLDIAINHTGWASKISSLHPEWLMRGSDGAIRSPGAWGVTWADLTELNHHQPELWNYLAEVFLYWCRRGVDGFRCDASYMIPVPAWEFIMASVRREFPGTVFLLEGLGGGMAATLSQLNYANLNWAYSELFQNYDRAQVENYLSFAAHVSESDGLLVHFAETHDNNRLAARSHAYARMRTALSALCSSNGAFAFANGVEWFATEKIDVHKRTSLNWNNPVNQVAHIARLNSILREHPAFFNGAVLQQVQRGQGKAIAVLRHHPPTGKKLLVLINLDDKSPQPVSWSESDTQLRSKNLTDLLSGREIPSGEGENTIELTPAEALCLTPDGDDMHLVISSHKKSLTDCVQINRQQLRAKALEALVALHHIEDVSGMDLEKMAQELAQDPRAFCRSLNKHNQEERVTVWQWPDDIKREVMVPPHYFLLLKADVPFRAQLKNDGRVLSRQDAIRQANGSYFVLFMPPAPPSDFSAFTLDLSVFLPEGTKHVLGHVLYLPEHAAKNVKMTFHRNDLFAFLSGGRPDDLLFLGTNSRGGMMRAAVKWGELRSKYDALLAGNLSTVFPEDRRVMLTRCRAWLVYHGYSQDITIDRLEKFSHGDGFARWQFRIPFGFGKMVFLEVEAAMLPGLNAVTLVFRREKSVSHGKTLADSENARLIIRPDVEDRNFHEVTKAFLGPEKAFPGAVQPLANGFVFGTDPARRLKVVVSRGVFSHHAEWQYMVPHPLEAERGLDSCSDLFSPGYFQCELKGGDEVVLAAQIITPNEKEENIFSVHRELAALRPPLTAALPAEEQVLSALGRALRQFIVKRGEMKTVIAGYPWFLDWGRDTLICCRGMIAAGMTDEVQRIIRRFAAYEEGGTIPNMLIGDNARNRESSDAPLWLFVAAAELTKAVGSCDWLNEKCGQRPLIEILRSIASSYRKGTANGITADSESGLIFSPAHFTWMDTSFPAGTPREGYPVEIQALWFAALEFLTQVTGEPEWHAMAGLVRASVRRFYWRADQRFLSDCLHCSRGTPAAEAQADDALRPNQLLVLTLGLVNDAEICDDVLSSCSQLLVPGAIRTLANRTLEYPLPVEKDGRILNDPKNPYWGRYEGDEDTRRKPAYHNGTAWTWLFPSFCEAWHKHYGSAGRHTALAILNSSMRLINRGCVGHIPEILDGDYPHILRGCDAQAWGVSELYRVWKMLATP
jgi:predicted glycogen debranching enzyme